MKEATKILTKKSKHFFIYFFIGVLLGTPSKALSLQECYKDLSLAPKNKIENIISSPDLIGIFYGCYLEDAKTLENYIPKDNCIDQGKKKIGQYDVKYSIYFDDKKHLIIKVNDPFVGKERSARVRKICFSDEKLVLKTRLINVQLYKESKKLLLSFNFLFKRYFLEVKKSFALLNN